MNRLLLLLTITVSSLTWAQSRGRCGEPINSTHLNTQTVYNNTTTQNTDPEEVITKVVRGEEITVAKKPSKNNTTAKKRTIIIVQEEEDGVFVTRQINLQEDQPQVAETTPCRGVDDSGACRPSKGRN